MRHVRNALRKWGYQKLGERAKAGSVVTRGGDRGGRPTGGLSKGGKKKDDSSFSNRGRDRMETSSYRYFNLQLSKRGQR